MRGFAIAQAWPLASLAALGAAGSLEGSLAWAWGRDHNVLSWHVGSLPILPLAFFSYRRSFSGIAPTLFWFPTSERVDPGIEAFLVFVGSLSPAPGPPVRRPRP